MINYERLERRNCNKVLIITSKVIGEDLKTVGSLLSYLKAYKYFLSSQVKTIINMIMIVEQTTFE